MSLRSKIAAAMPEVDRRASDEAYRAEHKKRIQEIESSHTQLARDWLTANGVVKDGMSRAEWNRARSEYLKKLFRAEPWAQPGNRDWAHTILTKIADGEVVPPICAQYAKEAA